MDCFKKNSAYLSKEERDAISIPAVIEIGVGKVQKKYAEVLKKMERNTSTRYS